MNCPICGVELLEEVPVCPKCGSAIEYVDYDEYGDNNRSVMDAWTMPLGESSQNAYYKAPGHDGYGKTNAAYVYTAPDSRETPLSLSAFLASIIAMSIPGIGLLIQIVWACGGAKRVNRKNMARAFLILSVIGIIASIILIAYVSPYVVELLDILQTMM